MYPEYLMAISTSAATSRDTGVEDGLKACIVSKDNSGLRSNWAREVGVLLGALPREAKVALSCMLGAIIVCSWRRISFSIAVFFSTVRRWSVALTRPIR